jgi:hypothetical protein
LLISTGQGIKQKKGDRIKSIQLSAVSKQKTGIGERQKCQLFVATTKRRQKAKEKQAPGIRNQVSGKDRKQLS